MGLGTLGLLDGDHAFVVDLGHRLGDQLTDRLVVVGRNGGYLLDLGEIRTDLLALLLERLHDRRNGLVDTALQVHRVGPGRHVLQADADDRLRQHGCGGRTVARIVVGLRSDFADHLGAHVGESVLQFHLLGHRHTVLGDLRSAEFLVDDHVAAFGTERYLNGVRQRVDTLLEQFARLYVIFNILCHDCLSILDDCQNIVLFHNEVVHAVDLDFLTGILAVEHLVALLDLHLDLRGSGAYCNDFACQRFLLGRVGDDQSAGRLLLRGIRENQHAVR